MTIYQIVDGVMIVLALYVLVARWWADRDDEVSNDDGRM